MNLIRNLEFKCGLVYCHKSQMVTFPINFFLTSYNFLTTKLGFEKSFDFFKDIFYDDCFIFYKNNFEGNSKKNKKFVILKFLEFLESLGISKFDLVKLNDKKIIFSQNRKHLKVEFENLFKKKAELEFRYFHCFFLKSYLEIIYGKKFNFDLTCSNYGNCYSFTKTEEDFKFESEKEYDTCCENIAPGWINKLIMNKKIINVDSKLMFNDVVNIGLPFFLYLNMLECIVENCYDELKFMLKSFGHNFSKTLDIKGLKKPSEKINYICDYWNLMGFGTLQSLNDNFTEFKFKTNYYDYAKKYYSEDFVKKLKSLQFLSVLGSFECCYDVCAKLVVEEDLSKFRISVLSENVDLDK